MTPTVMIPVLFAALLHASWNFLVKQADDKYVSVGAIVLGHAPFSVGAMLLLAPMPRPEAVPFILAGSAIHVGYQFFLLSAYRAGDLSQVYPLARGVAPLLVTCVSVAFLNVHLNPLEIVAVIVVAAGIISLSFARSKDGQRNKYAAVLALCTGGFIAAYSLVDGIGARKAGTALGFYGCLSTINAIVFAVFLRIYRPGAIRRIVFRHWPLTVCGGGASFTAYAIATWAFTRAPIALVTAVRETSIIFALLLGVLILKERLDGQKLLATTLTVLGICLMRIVR